MRRFRLPILTVFCICATGCSLQPGQPLGRMDAVLRFASVAQGTGCAQADCLPGAWRGHEWKWEQVASENRWVGQRALAAVEPGRSSKKAPEQLCDSNSVPFGGGKGTQTEPFLVCSTAQWESIDQAPASAYRIVADIDFSGKAPKRIAKFSGSIFGDGHRLSGARWQAVQQAALIDRNEGVIRDLWIEGFRLEADAPPTPDRVALFVLRNRGALRNIRGGEGNRLDLRHSPASRTPAAEIEEEDLLPVNAWRVGGIAAENSGVIEDSEWITQVTVAPEAEAVGGVVGWNRGTLRRLTARTWVSAPSSRAVGGMAGVNAGEVHQARLDLVPFEVHGGELRSTPSRVAGREAVGGLVGRNVGHISEAVIWASVQGAREVGGAVGLQAKQEARSSDIEFNGAVTGGSPVGGIVGRSTSGAKVSHCRSDALVETAAPPGSRDPVWAGGIVGVNEASVVESSRSHGVVSARGHGNAGGIVGGNAHLGGAFAQQGGRVERSVSTARVYAAGYVGGVAGENCVDCVVLDSNAHGLAEGGAPELHCYADKHAVGETAAGGVVGRNLGGVRGAYARIQASEVAPEAGGCGATGRVIGEGDLSRVRELASRAPAQTR